MSVIQDRQSVGGVGATQTKSGADTALELGAKVLAELATQGTSSTSMTVPTSVMQDLAAAVVQLAAELKKTQASIAAGSASPAKPASPKIDAQIRVYSGYSGSSLAHDDLKKIASSVREKAAELGINLKIELGAEFGGWFLGISGQAAKADLDKVKAHAAEVAIKSSQFAQGSSKVEVLKYDVI